MLVHLPIMLGVLAVVPAVVLCFDRFRSARLRAIGIAWFVLLSASSGAAAVSGNAAARGLEGRAPALTPDDRAAVAVHQYRGERAWIWPLFPATLIALSAHPRLRRSAGTCGVLAAALVSIWFCVVAHAGGRLVYARGLGVPQRPSLPVQADAIAP